MLSSKRDNQQENRFKRRQQQVHEYKAGTRIFHLSLPGSHFLLWIMFA